MKSEDACRLAFVFLILFSILTSTVSLGFILTGFSIGVVAAGLSFMVSILQYIAKADGLIHIVSSRKEKIQ